MVTCVFLFEGAKPMCTLHVTKYITDTVILIQTCNSYRLCLYGDVRMFTEEMVSHKNCAMVGGMALQVFMNWYITIVNI